jgi:hypothetical protein
VSDVQAHSGVGEYLFALPCVFLVLLFAFDLDMALRAPVCASAGELGGWCLPLGWEGPFSDYWSNHSRNNAIIDASFNLGAGLLVLTLCVLLARHQHPSHRSLAIMLQLALLLIVFLKGLVLNDPS